jgi:hypothetical protein
VTEHFTYSLNWRALLPAATAVAVFALAILPNAKTDPNAQASANTVADAHQVKHAAEALKKRVVEQRKKAEAESGLKDAADMFKKLEEAVDEMAKSEKKAISRRPWSKPRTWRKSLRTTS